MFSHTCIVFDSGNIMTRNDFALHMSKYNRHQESFDEFKKAIFIAGMLYFLIGPVVSLFGVVVILFVAIR